jgi:TRAP-type C4-dicarboxylate transport system permease small subunit
MSFIKPSRWTDELATFLLIWVALLGAAVALNRGAHLGIDYFVGKLEKKTQVKIEIFVYLCIALFSVFVMMLGGADLVQTTLSLRQKSPALGIDMGYVYLAVPVSGFFMALYSIIEFSARIRLLLKEPQAVNAFEPKHELPEEVD